MNYLLPNEWCDTFIPLQDKCPVSSYDSIRAMVLQDTGRSLDDFFSDFDPTPIGAASLAQVHRATVRETGQRVAVKVQHPALGLQQPLTAHPRQHDRPPVHRGRHQQHGSGDRGPSTGRCGRRALPEGGHGPNVLAHPTRVNPRATWSGG